ncbi:MAG: hypothetical protein P4N60_11905 [Verrucomicrobiae bacterium]|nr:hypothetical protein [Verrucomicrobiae bacterium]
MKKLVFGSFAIVALVAACVPSVNPFYTDKDVITDSRLAGRWAEDKDKDKGQPVTWTFSAATNSAYAVALVDDNGKTGQFTGHLFKLGDGLFLDLTPTECNYATNQADIVGNAMIPGHLLLRVGLEENKLNLAFCDPDWMKKFLEKNPSAIAHRTVDDCVILTAETRALQKFVLKHLGKDELFSDSGEYRRQATPAGAR